MNSEQELIAELRDIVGKPGLVEDEASQSAYLRDELGQFDGNALAIVRPASTEQVAAVVKACVAAGVGMVPHGGNTGYCGGATPDASGRQVLISLELMRRIHEVDAIGYTLTADAGCVLANLQAAAEEKGLLLPLSLGSEGSCQIGGNLSTNAGGLAVLHYGNARDLVLGLEVVLPDGEIWNGMKALRKDNSGYDLKQWFIGAEGTLGIITRVVLKLFPQPAFRATALVAVKSVAAACQLLGAARRQSGDAVTSFEYVPGVALDLVGQHVEGARIPFDEKHAHQVLIELSSQDEDIQTVLEQILERAFDSGQAEDAVIASSGEQRSALWRLRETVPEAQRHVGGTYKHDVSVPIAKIPQFMDAAGTAVSEAVAGVRICAYGHLGDGNLHFNLLPPEGQTLASFRDQYGEQVSRIIHDLALSFNGSVCAEHGVGQLKAGLLAQTSGPVALRLMRDLKRAVDPGGLMNPGKVLLAD